MYFLLIVVISYSVPFIVWMVWKKKSSARTFPLIVGMIAYLFISVFRGIARAIVLNDNVKENPWLFYVLSALLSGIFEEVGRYIVFRWCIPHDDQYRDCVSYGIGHSVMESFAISHVLENDIYDSFLEAGSFMTGILFSVAMSLLVFVAVHKLKDKKYLVIAVGLHTIIDIIPALYFCEVVDIGDEMLIRLLYLAGVCYFSYTVYRHSQNNA
ncbi:MAG TPA: hypothetical protein DCO72_10430 [Ruminococcus sp.]|nr:hypothetical protein [Ruminococcus sp.]